MLMRTIVAIASIMAFGASNGWADVYKGSNHHQDGRTVRYQQPILPAPPVGGRLVLHPASNIACNTVYRSTRALPCDQPVWVYGSPCEVDLGLGRYRSCN